MERVVVLQVPGEGAVFPAHDGLPTIMVVRDIRDKKVVPHEAGHAVWSATGQPQRYP